MELLIRASRNDHTMIEKLCAPASAGLWATRRLPLSGLVADASVAAERAQLRKVAAAATDAGNRRRRPAPMSAGRQAASTQTRTAAARAGTQASPRSHQCPGSCTEPRASLTTAMNDIDPLIAKWAFTSRAGGRLHPNTRNGSR